MRISRLLFTLLGLWAAGLSSAGTLFEFEYQALLIIESKDKLYGYYGSTLPKVQGVRPHPAQCRFFFYSKNGRGEEQYSANVFYTNGSFGVRRKSIDSPALIFRRNSNWIIQMRHQDASCDTAAGWNFRLDPDDPDVTKFEVVRSSEALFLRLIAKKANLLIRKTGFALSGISLVPGDVVVVDAEESGFSKVRFLNAQENKVATGWVESKFLVNPFPK